MRKYRVVLVEDEEIVLRELVETIDWEGLGMEVIGTAGDGIEGEEKIRTLSPDIIVTDIRLPGKDGLKMIEDASVANGIILSGYTDFEYTKKAIQLGVFDYIEKPVDDEELEASLRKLRLRIDEEEKDIDSISGEGQVEIRNNIQNHWIKIAVEYIEKNYAKQISLSDIARETKLSESHLSVLFKTETGINFLQYLNAVRITNATHLLLQTSMNVTEIASATGFPSPGYFTKMFRRFKGKTPTEYRNSHSDKEV